VRAGKRITEKGDARGGGFFLLPHCLLKSEAFRTASPRAIKVLMALCSKHNGFNNGAIGIGFRELAEAVDSQNHKANSKALCQCIERGLVELQRSYPRGQRLANEYRLTFVRTQDGPATNDYLTWQQGDAGTCRKRLGGNLRVGATATRSANPVAIISTVDAISRFDNYNGAHPKPPFSGLSPVEIASTHIFNHPMESPPFPCDSTSSMHKPLSAAPDPEELRARITATLSNAGRASQGQLAAMAQIHPAALSRFLKHGKPLNDSARLRLTLVLPSIATVSREVTA
jgi:hypothetical protein